MSKDTKAIMERRAAMIQDLTEGPQLRTRTGVKAGTTIGYIYPIMCLTIAPIIAITPVIVIKPQPDPW